jgi:uncharacterized UBP type Zn finger protein
VPKGLTEKQKISIINEQELQEPPEIKTNTSSPFLRASSSPPTFLQASSPSPSLKQTLLPNQGTRRNNSLEITRRPAKNMNHVGIVNTGVICWLISCIQLLYTIEELRKYFIEDFNIDSIDINAKPEARNFVMCLSRIFKEIHYKTDVDVDLRILEFEDNGIVYNVYEIIANLLLFSKYGLKIDRQCDADEGLNYIFNLLFDIAPELNILFNINFITNKYCKKTDTEIVTTINEFLYKIQLPINSKKKQVTLSSLIKTYQKKVDSDSSHRTDKCPPDNISKATQELIYPINNTYLIIQLIRCLGDSKNKTIVKYDDELTINNNKFKLQGIISHSGDTCNSGHYYYYRKLDDGRFIQLNDDLINYRNPDKNSYIYLYKRV